MNNEVIAAVLLAAALHAGWNGIIKFRGDRLVSMAVITFAAGVISLAFLPFVAVPDKASWPFLALSLLPHTAYNLFLPIAYDHGDLGLVYPVARGSSPLLVMFAAFLFANESMSPIALVGVLCLATGIMALAFEKGLRIAESPKAILYALLTAICIASYTFLDGMGARKSGSGFGFAVWLTAIDGILTFLIVVVWKRRAVWAMASGNLFTGILGGAMQAGAYCIVVSALAIAPMAMVSALRETSVLFAALISTLLLKEGFRVWRFVSIALVTAGLILTHGEN